jgi:O-antigen/teichoic acid export membrane protein
MAKQIGEKSVSKKQLQILQKFFNRFWNSPTLMTWGSFVTRSLSLVVVLPLILTRLSTEEIALWYLFSTIIGLQILVDVGFSSTFSRVIAYAMGGATNAELKDFRSISQSVRQSEPNWKTIEQIYSTMRTIYFGLAAIAILLLSTLGSWALLKPISATANVTSAWIAWGVIIVVSTINILGNPYSAYLQGVNQIALLRRWETFTSLGAITTSFIVLFLDGHLLPLVIANQSWVVLNNLRDLWLCLKVEEGRFKKFTNQRIDRIILEAVWPSAWRSGVGVFMSYGLVQISGVIYAQVGTASGVASYLLALRLIQMVSQFSQAPFYSKLPVLAKLRSEGNLEQQVSVAKRGMLLAYWTYVAGFIGLGILATPLLKLIGSNAEFVSPLLWGLMGLSIFAERYGAMHIQLYSTTNHIIWHIANGVSGVIYLVVSLALFKQIGVYAFPVGTLAGYLGFYCWYSAMHSYRAFGLKFWKFERLVMLKPLAVMLIYFTGTVLTSKNLV